MNSYAQRFTLKLAALLLLLTSTALYVCWERLRAPIESLPPLVQTVPPTSTGLAVSSNSVSASEPSASPAAIQYQVITLAGAKSVTQLKAKLGKERFATLLKINRRDENHLRKGDQLILPNTFLDVLAFSPLPSELPQAQLLPKLILVSRRAQAFGAYESGKLVRWGPTSTGKRSTPTPAGLYHANWKAKETTSSINPSWKLPWYVNLDNMGGIAFHQYDLPGYPASHGCVRLLGEDAEWLYGWATTWILSKTSNRVVAHGTPVIIFGEYEYGEKTRKPLAEAQPTSLISLPEVEQVLAQQLGTIKKRMQDRDSILVASLHASMWK